MTAPVTSPLTLLDTLDDPKLFADAFRPKASWAAWRTCSRRCSRWIRPRTISTRYRSTPAARRGP